MMARLMGLKTISPGDLHDLVREKQVCVIDVNSTQSWSESHVPGAIHLDPVRFDPSQLPADKSLPIVFYCSNTWCRKAPNAARRAGDFGYANVRVMPAGISGWLGAGLPVERTR